MSRYGAMIVVMLLMVIMMITKVVVASDPAAELGLINAVLDGDANAVEWFLTHNVDIDINAAHGRAGYWSSTTPLHCAAEKGHVDLIELMIKLRPDINLNEKDHDSVTALHFAAYAGQAAVVAYIVSKPEVDVNAQELASNTALHFASREGSIESVNALLTRSDLKVNLRDDLGWTALMSAASLGHIDIIRALLANELIQADLLDTNGLTAADIAIRGGNLRVVAAMRDMTLYNAADDVNSDLEWSFLMAVRINDTDRVRHVMSTKPLVNVNIVTCNGWTALMIAAYRGYIEIAHMLLDRDDMAITYSINRDSIHRSALQLAIEAQHDDIATMITNRINYGINAINIGVIFANKMSDFESGDLEQVVLEYVDLNDPIVEDTTTADRQCT